MSETVKSRAQAAKARRRARAERWRRPIETAHDRRLAWASLMLADHGVLRVVWKNRYRVTPRLWRSAQPSPGDLAWAARQGIRTVVSLRGDGFGGDLLEQEACAREGLAFHRLVLQSRMAPPTATLREAIDLLPRLETPVLLHCKSGADRAGLGTALFLILVEGRSAREAREALSLRYGHVRHARTGILDAFLEAFETTGEAAGLSFAEWVATVYDPHALKRAFHTNRAGDLLLSVLGRE